MHRMLLLVVMLGCGRTNAGDTQPPVASEPAPAKVPAEPAAPTAPTAPTAAHPRVSNLTPDAFEGAVLGMTRAELEAARPGAKPGDKPTMMTEVAESAGAPSYIDYYFTTETPPRLYLLTIFYPEELDARAAYAGFKVYGKEVRVDHGGGAQTRHLEVADVPFPVKVWEGTMMIQVEAKLPGMPAPGN